MDQSTGFLPQHSFLSNFEGFRTNFENSIKEQVTGNVDYLCLCYILLGYFSTMQKDQVYDQVVRVHVQILHVLIAGHHDRFFLLFITKTLITGRLNGRLFNFHLNQDVPKFNHRNLFLEDAEFLVNLLRRNDPTMDWKKCAEWLLNVRNRCLFVELNKEMKIKARFYRITQMFQERQSGEMKWRELKTTSCDLITLFQKELDYTNFDKKITKIYKILHEAFLRNSEDEVNGLKFHVAKKNLLPFIYGALKFTIVPYFPMKILPIHIGPNMDKLALLPHQREQWTVRRNPIPVILDVYQTVEEQFENEEYAETFDLPVGFACGAKKTLVCSLTLQEMNENIKISRNYVEIPANNGLLDLLIKLSSFDRDHFHQSIEHYRRELLLQLDRINTFLSHKHRMKTFRHFIFASLMTLGEEYTVYKLKRSFSLAVDVFLIKSRSDGIIIQLSHNSLDEPTATALEKCITDTGLQKFLVLSLNDRAYSYSIQGEATLNPTMGMVVSEYQQQEMSPPFLEPSVWTEVNRLFDGNWFMKMLIYPRDRRFQMSQWVEELYVHSMVPENQHQYLAQVKGLIAEKQVFQPYSTDFLGLRIEKYRTRNGIRVNIPFSIGVSMKTFHILLDTNLMITRDQSSPMSKLKTFFKKELSHSIKKLIV
uniref:Uncharacterized protein n=1 Tax=Romanomermis culicivorax TaxID=13658 RepID=A0A915IX71_ROMCU